MPVVVLNTLDSLVFVYTVRILSVLLTIIFLAYCFSKEGRDERGRGIVASSCVTGVIVLLVLLNICGQFSVSIMSSIKVYTSALGLTYDITVLSILLQIFIIRKIR